MQWTLALAMKKSRLDKTIDMVQGLRVASGFLTLNACKKSQQGMQFIVASLRIATFQLIAIEI